MRARIGQAGATARRAPSGDAIAAAAAASTASRTSTRATRPSTAPVVRLLELDPRTARSSDRASDVHFEVFDDELRIRYRVDGALYEVEAPPAHLAVPAGRAHQGDGDLDIAETRMPQDGRIELSIDGRPVDLRVATMPQESPARVACCACSTAAPCS